MRTPLQTFKDERAMRERNYRLLIEQAIRLLTDYNSRITSTHLGHNLSNVAHELSVAAAKVESAQAAIMWAQEYEDETDLSVHGLNEYGVQRLLTFIRSVRDETDLTGGDEDTNQLEILRDHASNLLKSLEKE